MKKVTLSFPDPKSLWSFKEQSNAVNVAVAPKKNIIAGLFSSDEVEKAIELLGAVKLDNATISTATTAIKHTETTTGKPSFRVRFSQLLSMLNL